MSISSGQRLPGFGCRNALTRLAWSPLCRKQTSAGLFWTRTASCLDNRGRPGRFARPATRAPGVPPLHAIVTRADRIGAPHEVTATTPLTRTYIVAEVWSFLRNHPNLSDAGS